MIVSDSDRSDFLSRCHGGYRLIDYRKVDEKEGERFEEDERSVKNTFEALKTSCVNRKKDDQREWWME